MTREKAREYVENCLYRVEDGADDPDVTDAMMVARRTKLYAAIDAEIAAAVAEERERIIRLVDGTDDFEHGYWETPQDKTDDLVAAIRGRQ